MRRLILMRHAKSSWSSGAPTDHERPLNKRGRRASKAMGLELRRIGWIPQRVVLSDSVRTQETLRRMKLPETVDVALSPDLYHGETDEIRASLEQEGDATTLMLLGHEPGWSEALAWLSGRSVELKTADAALLVARNVGPWRSLASGPEQFDLLRVIRSRQVMEAPLPPRGSAVVP